MDDEKNFSVVRSIRISPEHQRKIAESGINLSEFLRKKLDDEFSEDYLIEQQIGHHERQLMKWRERRQRQNAKQKSMFNLSDDEIEFLERTRELLNEKLRPVLNMSRRVVGFLVQQEVEGVCKHPLKQRLSLFVRVVVGCRWSVLGYEWSLGIHRVPG